VVTVETAVFWVKMGASYSSETSVLILPHYISEEVAMLHTILYHRTFDGEGEVIKRLAKKSYGGLAPPLLTSALNGR
jgi:hypothetical protein